ncbi:MAG: phosphatidylglycerophosphatase A [Gammaproteobacteria bacterium]|nr:phosphatidylglycerophosphatase A [Gammaproteobacteria bacterium]
MATFFYIGKVPIAPGTFGTLAAVPVAIVLGLTNPMFFVFGTIIMGIIAVVVSHLYESQFGVHDSGAIVIDEVVGFLVAVIWLPLTWKTLVAGFLIFRLLDILKPFPINVIDRKIKGGVGVVLDDVAAGVVTNVVLQVTYYHTTWLT